MSVYQITHCLDNANKAQAVSKRAFYTESRESGGITIIEITNQGLKDVLPVEYGAKNSVYEYGGSPFAILSDDHIIFSNKDNSVHILNPDTQQVSRLTGHDILRYSNFDAHPASPWVLANQESHENDTPEGVRNYIVAINTETAEVRRLLDTADFYYTPYFSPDGGRLAWLEWNHPDLPYDAAKLYTATWNKNGSISDVRLVSGKEKEGAAEPRWGVDGTLFFAKELRGYRRLFRHRPGQSEPVEVKLDGLDDADFAEINWYQGRQVLSKAKD